MTGTGLAAAGIFDPALWTLLGAVFAASLIGSLHCAGMCGPFVAFYAGSDATNRRSRAHVAYNLGRATTYVALGATAGWLGSLLDWAGQLAGLQRVAAVVAGGAMVAWGTVTLLRHLGVPLGFGSGRGPLTRLLARVSRSLQSRPPTVRALIMGLLTTLLPCGWLYAFVVSAAGTGDAAHGALVMAAFWAGTVPMLVGLGVGMSWLSAPLRRHLPVVTALALVVVGLVAVIGRASLDPSALVHRAEAANAAGSLQGDGSQPGSGACCHE